MRDLLVLKARLEELVERLERLQAIPSQAQGEVRVQALAREALRGLRPVGIALDLIEDQLVHGDRPVSSGELIAEAIARASGQTGVRAIDLDALELDPGMVRYVPRDVAVRHRLIMLGFRQEPSCEIFLRIAMADPTNVSAADDVVSLTGHRLEIYVASADAIERAIAKYYAEPSPDEPPPPPAAAAA